jgi:ATP-dependent DNA helicase RecG
VDELGSGVRNTFKYCGIYTPGTKPEFIEDDVFRTIIPLKVKESKETVSASDWDKVRRKVRGKFGGSSEKIVELIFGNQYISASKMAEEIGITKRAVEKQLSKLKEKDIVDRVGPDKGGYWKINV